MQELTTLIHNEIGLHARPAALLVKTAKQFKSTVTITYKGKTVNAKSLVLLLGLGVAKQAEVTLTTEGEDEQEAIHALNALIERKFAE
ncbi:MAG TPA: HPr family phosphocarrier protein [Ktedonobacteraceae bacterium]|nr:HPr family phosphocarrier protein [Ktedonobacteraceae bacterium]